MVGGEEEWGEPVERCMHCFMDFPLSRIVEHSNKCMGDALGSRDRFKNFIPSVHDVSTLISLDAADFKISVLSFQISLYIQHYHFRSLYCIYVL